MRTPLRTGCERPRARRALVVPPALAQQLTTGTPAPSPVIDMPPDSRQISLTLGAGLAKRTLYCGGCSQSMGFSGLANLSRFVGQSTALGMESTVWVKNAGPPTAGLLSAVAGDSVSTWKSPVALRWSPTSAISTLSGDSMSGEPSRS